MIRLKNSLLVNDEFAKLLKSLSSHKIPVSTGLRLLKAYKAMETERSLILESKNEMIKRYGIPDGRGGFSIPASDTEAIRDFSRDFGELLALECELPIPEKIKLAAPINDRDSHEILFTVAELAMLSELIDFEESGESKE